MSKRMNLTGLKFDKLTVLSFYDVQNGKTRWLCQCDCKDKNTVIVYGSHLTNGNTKSCGCLKSICAKELSKQNKKYNKYDLSGEYGIGYTSKGEEFYFDLEDYDRIKDYCWRISKDGYVITIGGISLHTVVMNTSNIQKVDHKQHNKIDNRKNQLRICTIQKNNMNKTIAKNNTSGVTGVGWDKKGNKWIARIKINKKLLYLGSFVNFDDAVEARKEAEEKYFGEYSYDNSMKVGV